MWNLAGLGQANSYVAISHQAELDHYRMYDLQQHWAHVCQFKSDILVSVPKKVHRLCEC